MLWIALHLPDLPLQVFTRGVADPGVLAVVDHRPRQHLVAVSPAALALGVEPGSNVAGALSVAPGLELLERKHALEQETLQSFATWAYRFSPRVSIDSSCGIVLEVESCLRLFGGLNALVILIRSGAEALGLNIRLAAAPSPLAARWLAESAPDTLIHHAPGWSRCLDALPVQVIALADAVSTATLDLLAGIGITRIGELCRLPRDALARRQASNVLDILSRARGDTPDPRRWHIPPERFESRLVLPAAVSSSEPLLFASGRLIADMVAWLQSLHAAIDRCHLFLEHEHHEDSVVSIVTAQPASDEIRLLLILREQLAALTLAEPVDALRLCADSPLVPTADTQDLFHAPGQDCDAAIFLLERLRARLGSDAVRSLQSWPDHRPEYAWRVSEPGAGKYDGMPERPPRPAWLLPQPRPLASIRALEILCGPERIASGWWDGKDVCRDYFIARTPESAMWWIFRRLDPPQGWYLHGYFG